MVRRLDASAGGVTTRAPRRDALANRARLIAAASKVFGEHGTDASLDLVAAEAGLGIATMYRRFPTKEVLISEVVEAILRHIVEVARAETAGSDGRGLERWLATYGDIQSRRSGLVARFWVPGDSRIGQLRAELMVHLDELVRQAKGRRRLRPDAELSDIVLTIFALQGIAQTLAHPDEQSWRRHVSVVLAGLRPSRMKLSDGPWPLPSPSL